MPREKRFAMCRADMAQVDRSVNLELPRTQPTCGRRPPRVAPSGSAVGPLQMDGRARGFGMEQASGRSRSLYFIFNTAPFMHYTHHTLSPYVNMYVKNPPYTTRTAGVSTKLLLRTRSQPATLRRPGARCKALLGSLNLNESVSLGHASCVLH